MTAHKQYITRLWNAEFIPEVGEAMYDSADDGPEVNVIQNFFVFPEGWRGLNSYTLEEKKRACGFES